jgi:hypothetical protein
VPALKKDAGALPDETLGVAEVREDLDEMSDEVAKTGRKPRRAQGHGK